MQTKLLLFYGPGSGSGKSTLSRLIHDVLQQRSISTKYVAESDVFHLEAFAPYVAEVKKNNPGNVKVLLSSCERFIDAYNQSDQVYVVDSILLCTDWLVTAGCTRQQIRRFNTQLNRLMTQLNPIQIFLTGDTEIFLKRAMKDPIEVRTGRGASRKKDVTATTYKTSSLISMRWGKSPLNYWLNGNSKKSCWTQQSMTCRPAPRRYFDTLVLIKTFTQTSAK